MDGRLRARWAVPLPLLLLAGCSGGGGSPSGPPQDAPPMRLVAYDGCDELLDGLRRTAAKRVGPYGLGGDGRLMKQAVPAAPEAQRGAVPGAAAPDRPADHSRTNAHEAGADEPDLVKTDGRRIVALARGDLYVIDPATRKVAHRLELPRAGGGGGIRFVPTRSQLLLSGDRALVLTPGARMTMRGRLPGAVAPGAEGSGAGRPGAEGPGPDRDAARTRLTLVDLSGAPRIVGTMTTGATYVDARQTGSIARVVVRSTPDLDFPSVPRGDGGKRKAVARNRTIIGSAPLKAWLPSFAVDAGGRSTTYTPACGQVSRPASATGTSIMTVLTFDLSKGLGDPRPVGVAADGQTVYATGTTLYLTGTERKKTNVHKFVTKGSARPRYVASGAVPGSLLNQYSISEHAGYLRLATTRNQAGSSRDQVSAVYVLAQKDGRLEQEDKVGGLGKGERIYAVRFLGSAAYVVTFRQVDPLYVIDLSRPGGSRVTGELKITGYSAYLHPVSPGYLLGVGQEADRSGRRQGTLVSLFSVGDGKPKRVDSYRLPGSSAAAEFEPHAFLYWPRSGMTVIPVNHRTGDNEALVLRTTLAGVERRGAVEHPDGRITRSLVFGNTLWTFSDRGARASDASSLDDLGWVPFD